MERREDRDFIFRQALLNLGEARAHAGTLERRDGPIRRSSQWRKGQARRARDCS